MIDFTIQSHLFCTVRNSEVSSKLPLIITVGILDHFRVCFSFFLGFWKAFSDLGRSGFEGGGDLVSLSRTVSEKQDDLCYAYDPVHQFRALHLRCFWDQDEYGKLNPTRLRLSLGLKWLHRLATSWHIVRM